jgi:hypothetical protein
VTSINEYGAETEEQGKNCDDGAKYGNGDDDRDQDRSKPRPNPEPSEGPPVFTAGVTDKLITVVDLGPCTVPTIPRVPRESNLNDPQRYLLHNRAQREPDIPMNLVSPTIK